MVDKKVKLKEYLRVIVFEHPDTTRRAIIDTMSDWMYEQSGDNRDYKFIDAFIRQIQGAINREYYRRIHAVSGQKGEYQRLDYLVGQELPGYQWETAQKIRRDLLAYLRSLPPDEAIGFLAELIAAYFFSCPEALIRANLKYLESLSNLPASDFELAYGLWVEFWMDLGDFTIGIG